MTADESVKTAFDLIDLVSCAANGEIPSKERIDRMDLAALYETAKAQSLCAMAAFALEKAGVQEPRFRETKAKAIRKTALFDAERAKISAALSKRGIRHMPLKGAVLKDCYPSYGLREMSDNDVLCDGDRMEDVREVMEGLGFSCIEFGHPVRDIYHKPPSISFEMHRCLYYEGIDYQKTLFDYYKDIDRLMIRDAENSFSYHLSHEDFYLFILSHEFKHYHHAGTGLRSLLDVYLFLKKHGDTLDFDYINGELERLSLTEFERLNRELSKKLFTRQTLSKQDREELSFFIASGTYGTVAIKRENTLNRKLGGSDLELSKRKYLFDRVFVKGEKLKKHYPFFDKHRALLPALYVYRLGLGAVKHPKKNLKEYQAVRDYTVSKKD